MSVMVSRCVGLCVVPCTAAYVIWPEQAQYTRETSSQSSNQGRLSHSAYQFQSACASEEADMASYWRCEIQVIVFHVRAARAIVTFGVESSLLTLSLTKTSRLLQYVLLFFPLVEVDGI